MTDPTTQPAPTLEGVEAALAKLDSHTASILRRHLGLAPAEPAPEPPKAEPTAAPPLDLDPTARAIDPEALQRLDAEIEEKAKAKAEQEAAKRAAEQDPAIVAALEPIKAHARRLSPVKRRMIESSVKIATSLPDEVVYQHSVFCQTVLPYRNPGDEVRKWERAQGSVRLQLTAGEINDKKQGCFVPVGLPYGPAARLILAHLNTAALRTHDRVIEVKDSLTAFVRRLHGFDPDGRQVRKAKEQLLRLSACLMRFAFDTGPASIQVDTKVISAFDLWEERFQGDQFLFPQFIALSAEYFLNLIAHAVPLDERAVAALAHSAMGLDVYMWLAQRAHRVDPQRPQFIPWTTLHAQFGQGYKELKFFRRDFRATLTQVLSQYPAARAKTDKKGMLLANSPPPVPPRRLILLPPAKPAKG